MTNNCFSWCNPKNLSQIWQFRLMGIVLLILGIAEYGVDIMENYIIAAHSKTDETVYQYSGTILSIFSQVFIFVNTGFLTMLTVRETAANDATANKRKNVSRVFHFAVTVGLVSGLAVMCVLLFLRVELFDMLRQREYADYATKFFYIRAPFIPFEYVSNVIASALTGLMQIKPLLIASIVSNGLYLPVLLLLIKFMDDTVAAIAWANGFQIMVYLILFIVILASRDFRDQYEIFDFSSYTKRGAKTPLLTSKREEEGQGLAHKDEETEKDTTTIGEMGKASGLLFAKNFFSTLASISGSILLSSRLSTDQFVANNVLSNTIQFSSFAAFFNTVLNIFGPRFISTGNKERYMGVFKKAHINIAVLGVASVIAFFAFHVGQVSVDNLTSSSDESEVENYLKPIWPLWLANLFFSMWVNLYDTTMINFQQYKVLGIIGIVNAVFIAIPINLISVLKYQSLVGIILSGLASNIVELLVTAYLFHFKLIKDPKWEQNKPLETTTSSPSPSSSSSPLSSSSGAAVIN